METTGYIKELKESAQTKTTTNGTTTNTIDWNPPTPTGVCVPSVATVRVVDEAVIIHRGTPCHGGRTLGSPTQQAGFLSHLKTTTRSCTRRLSNAFIRLL